MRGNNLEEIFKQLDETRLALHRNLMAYDDDMPMYYDHFLEELGRLNEMTSDLSLMKKPLGYPNTFADLKEVVINHDRYDEEEVLKEYKSLDAFLIYVNENLCKHFDASIGCTWDTIDVHLDQILK